MADIFVIVYLLLVVFGKCESVYMKTATELLSMSSRGLKRRPQVEVYIFSSVV